MTKYLATFTGRRIGAIGKVYPMYEFVVADNPEAARQKLYGKFEHITGLEIAPHTNAGKITRSIRL